MALKKSIRKENGVSVSYHRIAMIKIDLNQQITILVESYIDENGRNYEKSYAAGQIEGEPIFPYTDAEYINIEYSEDLDLMKGNVVQNAYEWLKTQPDFVGAENI